MENSKIKEHIINANNSKLKYISLISLGFSVFTLFTDFFVRGVWSDESLYVYKVLDIALAIMSLLAVFFFWLFKIKNSTLQKTVILLFPFLCIIWSAVITGIDYGILGLSTLITIILLTTFFLYLNLIVSIVYFVGAALALITTIYFMVEINENFLSLIFLLIPIVGISIYISAKNYKNKVNDLFNQEKMVELNLKLKESNENLEREVETRTKEILLALRKAEESDRLKSAFLANVSHEIRTPMNGILGFSELLKEPGLTGEEQLEYINIIEKSGLRMVNIINDIIDISKIESGQIRVSISETNINKQVEYICSFFKPEVEQKGLTILFKDNLPGNEAIIKTDKDKVLAILSNLVKNAIKFTKTGTIELGYSWSDSPTGSACKPVELQFFVKDTGVGIKPEKMEIIFERFRQGSEALTRSYEGSGLGLSITKAYVEMLGGKIWVESEEGIGSTFYFTLPCNRDS